MLLIYVKWTYFKTSYLCKESKHQYPLFSTYFQPINYVNETRFCKHNPKPTIAFSKYVKFPTSHRVWMGVILYICCVFPEHFFLRMDGHFSSFNFFNIWGRTTSFSIVSWSYINMCEFTYNQYGSRSKTPYTLKL